MNAAIVFDGAAMLMTRFYLALGLSLVVSAPMAIPMATTAARAEDAPAAGCTLASASFLASPDQGEVTINCTGLSEAFGRQLAEIGTRILKNRLGLRRVLPEHEERERVPEARISRPVVEQQRQ